ncbi:MAG: hypothetical protein Q8Q59_15885 [Luteolibacter sp.]|nr:hypothetical protein [Luteolibacter sp.]
MSIESLLSPLSALSLMRTDDHPPTLHGLLVLHPYQAHFAGYVSITTDIYEKTGIPPAPSGSSPLRRPISSASCAAMSPP